MHFEKIHNKGQARLFKNDFLEALTKAHPLVIWGMYIPILSYLIYLAATQYDFSTKTILLVFFGGMLFWTLFEYIAHRFIFHWVPKGPGATDLRVPERVGVRGRRVGRPGEDPQHRLRLFLHHGGDGGGG